MRTLQLEGEYYRTMLYNNISSREEIKNNTNDIEEFYTIESFGYKQNGY